MATFPKLFNLKSAAHSRTPFNLSSRTITTGEFFQFQPVKMIECVPGDKFKIDMSVFARTAPLSVPSFDRAVIQTRAFFVPNRLTYHWFNDFICGNKVSVNNLMTVPSIPLVDSATLTEFFATASINFVDGNEYLSTVVGDPNAEFDFYYQPTSGTLQKLNLTSVGRQILKVFEGLGYKWNWVDNQRLSANTTLVCEFSALPLLAFGRIYLDWFVPSQYQVTHPLQNFFNTILSTPSPGSLTVSNLVSFFELLTPAYDEDYFTSAWLYPNSVNNSGGIVTPPSLQDFGNNSAQQPQNQTVGTVVGSNNINLARQSNGSNNLYRISQYALNLLEGMANYVIRNNYAGSRAVEQILARFGVRVPDTRMNRCEFLGKDDTDIQFMEVTSMADSGNYDLGQFGGKGVAYSSNGKFEYDVKEYGYIIIVSTIVPKIMYVQGFDRALLHKSRFDFFTPEFDCVGPQAIASGELYADCRDKQGDTFQDVSSNNGGCEDVFGYCPRYTEYKVNKDLLCGDFNVPHLNDGGALNAFHFARLVHIDSRFAAQAQNTFLFAAGKQYNRIFNVNSNVADADHFYMWYKFDITAYRPMRSISDSIPLDGDGEKIEMQPNGVHLS